MSKELTARVTVLFKTTDPSTEVKAFAARVTVWLMTTSASLMASADTAKAKVSGIRIEADSESPREVARVND